MALGMEVGLRTDHFVLDGDPSPFPKGAEQHPPQKNLAHVYCGQTAGWIKMALGMEVGLSPVDFVLDRDPAPSPKRGGASAIFGPCLLRPNRWMDQDAAASAYATLG